ncbi:hypothetical protein ABK040_003004 [Willaertia magna]
MGKNNSKPIDRILLQPTFAVYPTCGEWDLNKLKKMVLDGKLCPFYMPVEEAPSLKSLLEKAGHHCADLDDSEILQESLIMMEENAKSSSNHHHLHDHHRNNNGNNKSRKGSNNNNNQKEVGNQQLLSLDDFYDECPICLWYYQGGMNITSCCRQRICSECYLQICRGGPKEIQNSICPFCKACPFHIVYKGAKSWEERRKDLQEEQTVITLKIKHEQEEKRQQEEERRKRLENNNNTSMNTSTISTNTATTPIMLGSSATINSTSPSTSSVLIEEESLFNPNIMVLNNNGSHHSSPNVINNNNRYTNNHVVTNNNNRYSSEDSDSYDTTTRNVNNLLEYLFHQREDDSYYNNINNNMTSNDLHPLFSYILNSNRQPQQQQRPIHSTNINNDRMVGDNTPTTLSPIIPRSSTTINNNSVEENNTVNDIQFMPNFSELIPRTIDVSNANADDEMLKEAIRLSLMEKPIEPITVELSDISTPLNVVNSNNVNDHTSNVDVNNNSISEDDMDDELRMVLQLSLREK